MSKKIVLKGLLVIATIGILSIGVIGTDYVQNKSNVTKTVAPVKKVIEKATQKDYKNIKYAIELYNEAKEIEKEDSEYKTNSLLIRYSNVLQFLNSVKVVPDEYKKQAEDIKIDAESKKTIYANLQQEQEKAHKRQQLLKDADNRTLDPQPVSIGMTQEEVLTEGWGRPQDINRTETAYSVHEQWCYDGYKYLYFEDGILTTIQN